MIEAVSDLAPPPLGLRHRALALWGRHGRTFWILHSLWALAVGVGVLFLAHERYGFVPWVVCFLGLTWISTLFFSRDRAGHDDGTAPSANFGRGLASYLTRVMYQETLFFLLPFYLYSTVFPSWNVVFTAALAVLAVLACLDLVFDRWLRKSPVFGLVFFASVAFGALNLLLPMVWSLAPRVATPAAAGAAIASALPLALRGHGRSRASYAWSAVAALAILAVAIRAPQLVPPVPLRLQTATFSRDIDRATLRTSDVLPGIVDRQTLSHGLVVVATVFAPSNVRPASCSTGTGTTCSSGVRARSPSSRTRAVSACGKRSVRRTDSCPRGATGWSCGRLTIGCSGRRGSGCGRTGRLQSARRHGSSASCGREFRGVARGSSGDREAAGRRCRGDSLSDGRG